MSDSGASVNGIRVQLGRTRFFLRWPFDYGWETSLMAPKLYGVGVFIERSEWPDAR